MIIVTDKGGFTVPIFASTLKESVQLPLEKDLEEFEVNKDSSTTLRDNYEAKELQEEILENKEAKSIYVKDLEQEIRDLKWKIRQIEADSCIETSGLRSEMNWKNLRAKYANIVEENKDLKTKVQTLENVIALKSQNEQYVRNLHKEIRMLEKQNETYNQNKPIGQDQPLREDEDQGMAYFEQQQQLEQMQQIYDFDIQQLKEENDVKNAYIQSLEKMAQEQELKILKLEYENRLDPINRMYEENWHELWLELKDEKDQHEALRSKVYDLQEELLTSSEVRKITCEKEQSCQTTSIRQGEKELLSQIIILAMSMEEIVKSLFGVFNKELDDQQKRYKEERAQYENSLVKAEESIQNQGIQMTTQYKDKVEELDVKQIEAQSVIGGLLKECERVQLELKNVKDETQEKSKVHQQEIKQGQSRVEEVLKLIRAKDETIKQLSQFKIAQTQQILNSRKEMKAYEEETSLKYNKMLTQIYEVHRAEVESLKERVKSLELAGTKENSISGK